MKLNRLESTTQRLSQESRERARHVAGQQVRRVESLEGIEGDRQRSLQQEMAEIEAGAIGEFSGAQRVFQDAREMAAELAALGTAADELIKGDALGAATGHIDDQA